MVRNLFTDIRRNPTLTLPASIFFLLSLDTHTRMSWVSYRIRPIKRKDLNKRTPPLLFTVRGGMASPIVMKKLVKLPPRRSKKCKVIPFLLQSVQTSAEFRHFSSSFGLSVFIFAA